MQIYFFSEMKSNLDSKIPFCHPWHKQGLFIHLDSPHPLFVRSLENDRLPPVSVNGEWSHFVDAMAHAVTLRWPRIALQSWVSTFVPLLWYLLRSPEANQALSGQFLPLQNVILHGATFKWIFTWSGKVNTSKHGAQHSLPPRMKFILRQQQHHNTAVLVQFALGNHQCPILLQLWHKC